MRVVFMGSPDFAVPPLEALLAHHHVVLVVTQPDKPAGRGKRMLAPPVKDIAEAAGVPVIQPRSARKPEFAELLRQTGADIGVVVAYGKILPRAVLESFPRGCINVHGSLLPKYRGAAPIQWSVIRGETETGVTIMRLDEGMDTGPMLFTRTMPIAPHDTAGSVFERMAPLGAEALLEAMRGLEEGTLAEIPQDHQAATHAPMLTKEDGIIDWSQSAVDVCNRIRGVDPWPGAETMLPGSGEGERLKLFAPSVVAAAGKAPGELIGVDERGMIIACGPAGQGACAIAEVQAPGRKRMPARAFMSGRRLAPGIILGVGAPQPAAPEGREGGA